MSYFKTILLFLIITYQSFSPAAGVQCSQILSSYSFPQLTPKTFWQMTNINRGRGLPITFPKQEVLSTLKSFEKILSEFEIAMATEGQFNLSDKKVADVLKRRIQKVDSLDRIPYEDFLYLSAHMSLIATRTLALSKKLEAWSSNLTPDFDTTFKWMIENPHSNRVFSVMRDRSGKVTYSEESVLFAPDLLNMNRLLLLPTSNVLSISDFVQNFAYPVFYVGLIQGIAKADGVIFNPFSFFNHDLEHAIDLIASFTSENLRERIALQNKFNNSLSKISDTYLRKTVETWWFYMIHEQNVQFEASAIKDFSDRAFSNRWHDIDKFKQRIKDPSDFGPIFEGTSRPDEAAIKWVIEWSRSIVR